ncbi:hypothetical protein BV509_00920 [Rhodovulum sulfidophilum]|uniref:Uncharacterized protein n=1 Tax=Rhodovulum visakhapatnamense TaxID=364297 RepID=A0ABS1RFI2_9RHOB|nr:hypothetical protein [Rhodovulum visakhapatnamense]MBL3569898.1 hypothetical protein [Rhodovulum visakhapatnamense]MBL3578409.1 hypothetical protein [Rhodovulum visakhapatnamense]OLS43051.1 hypothetical protein BV509_00920 [Rhodovulum sulfidophilum]
MAEPKLSIADQVLVNHAAFLATLRISAGREADIKLARDVMRDVLPRTNRKHKYLAPVIEAAQAVVDELGAEEWRGFELAAALAEFFRWRGALAYDAFAVGSGEEGAA